MNTMTIRELFELFAIILDDDAHEPGCLCSAHDDDTPPHGIERVNLIDCTPELRAAMRENTL